MVLAATSWPLRDTRRPPSPPLPPTTTPARRTEEALNFGGTQEITAGSRARMEEVDAVVAKLEDKLGNNWAEFTSSRSSFGVEANSIVRDLDSWRGTEQERLYVLEKCEDHGIG